MPLKIERVILPLALMIVFTLVSANVASAQSYQTYGTTYYSYAPVQNVSSQVWYSYTPVYPSQYIAPTYRVAQGTVITNGYSVQGTPVITQKSGQVVPPTNRNISQGVVRTNSQPIRQINYQPVIQQSYPVYSGYSTPICIGGS